MSVLLFVATFALLGVTFFTCAPDAGHGEGVEQDAEPGVVGGCRLGQVQN